MNLDNSKYAWLAGWVRKLNQGEAYVATKRHTDAEGSFTCEVSSFVGVVYKVAAEKGWKATVVTGDRQVAFAFFKPNDFMRPNMPALPVVRKMKGL